MECTAYQRVTNARLSREFVDARFLGTTIRATVSMDEMPNPATTSAEMASELDRLRRLERERALILDAAGEGIYGLDCDGHATFVNQTAMEVLGWTLEDLTGGSVHELHHHTRADGSAYPREQCPIYAAFKDGQVHRVDDEVFWHKDGHCIPVEYTSTPIRDALGRLAGAVVVFRDITERSRAEREKVDAFERIAELKDELERERDYLREEVNVALSFGNIVGESPALNRVLAQIDAVAPTSANVLILGESGVGKELVARAIHARSPRAERALIKVNCASIPKDLFESEFFGHVKGSFTGAHRDRVGRFQLADGGTLFLDEVGEIPLDLQGKLLRALQEKEFERVGEERTRQVNVRVVAATNRDLRADVADGRFRQDLYYRLNVFPLEVPALRERREDIVALAQHFLEHAGKELGRHGFALNRRQAEMLERYEWPGNIRELQNVIERALILSNDNHLRLELAMPDADTEQATPRTTPETSPPSGSFLTAAELSESERINLIAALEHAQWRVSGAGGAAELLGLKPTTLAYRMKTLGIEKPR